MSLKKKILIVEDDPDIAEILNYNLKNTGYDTSIAENGKEAVTATKSFMPDVILMDIMMPVMDGVQACKLIRTIPKLKEVYIIFLTARGEEYSEIAAFEAGGNDYIIKPIKPRALITRLEVYFKSQKTEPDKNNSIINIKDLLIDRDSFNVFKDSKRIVLAKKEFELLYYLCLNANKTCKREEIIKQVWGTDIHVLSRTVDVHVRKIREKLEGDYINTIKGIGYIVYFN